MTDLFDSVKQAFADSYRVESEIGRGGMATVYLAEDLKHHRKVAVKVLQPEIAAALGQDRFLLEIETVARLHHPHILALYDSGEAHGFLYYVMPFVEGESLRGRLDREKQLPLDDALHIAREVADALSYAHSHDVVHRDIKPENIMLEADHAVVTDFGIATAITESGGDRLTGTGIALGTPAYMSPEQAAGSKDIDGRSDLYSLGCVLYEMLAGQAPFTGPTIESIVHQHLVVEPPSVTSIRPAIPAEVAGTIQRALSKTPADRFSPAAQFAEALVSKSAAPTVAALPRRRVPTGILGIVMIAVLLLATVIVWRTTTRPQPIVSAELQQVTFNGNVIEATMSPDGQFLAYMTSDPDGTVLLVQDLDGGQPIELYSDESFTCCPQWSPDGSQILFQAGARGSGSSVVVPRLGGTPRRLIAEAVAIWSPDGSQIASWWPQAQRIWLTDVTSGDTTGSIPMTDHDWVKGVDWSPHDDGLAIITFTAGKHTLWISSLDGSDRQVVLEDTVGILSPKFSPDGSAIYFLRVADAGLTELWKVRVSSSGAARGNAERVVSSAAVGVRHGSIPSYSISSDGSKLLYTRVVSHSNLWLYEVDPSRPEQPALTRQLTSGTATRGTPRLSPDGSRIVFLEATGGGRNLHIIPITGGTAHQVTFVDTQVWSPAWSPDGSQVAFGSTREGVPSILVVDADGGTPREYDSATFEPGNLLAWSPAQSITYQLPGDHDFVTLDPLTREERSLIDGNTNGWLYDPRPGPDNRRIAIYWLRSPAESTGTWLLSPEQPTQQFVIGGFFPIGWSADGQSVYAMQQDLRRDKSQDVYRIPLNTGTPILLTTLPVPVMPWEVSITPDGTLIVAAVEERQSDAWVVKNFDPSR